MGNSGSQNTTVTEATSNEQWVQSFPRTQHPHSKLNFQHKVLPERNAHLKLRSTNNGEIIHSGGTISGRNVRLTEEIEDRNVEHSKVCDECDSNDGQNVFREKDSSRKTAANGVKHKLINNISSQQIKSFASEPDLRYTSMNIGHEFREKKSKKKYKAPSPPQKYTIGNEKPSPRHDDVLNPGLPIRKARLFKTRAETKKQSSHSNEKSDDNSVNNSNINTNEKNKRLSLPEVKLINSNDFYKELKDATKKLRSVKAENSRKQEKTYRTKLNTLDPNISNSRDLQEKLMIKIESQSQSKLSMIHCSRGEASGKESTTPDMSPLPTSRDLATKDHRPKLFYFGMDEDVKREKPPTKEVFDNFSSNALAKHSSGSDISSDIESDENDIIRSGIDLQLRPILPKKQLEIPRFSPSAAWRLLSMDANDNTTGTILSDDVPILMEDHIEKYSRPPPPLVNAGQRSNNDKSGDSGISGDDGDAAIPIAYCFDDVISANDANTAVHQNKISIKYLNKPERTSWTPQQDLGDDSSTEEEMNDSKNMPHTPRQHLGPHTFSLSLPRDNRLAAYMSDKTNSPHYSGLQKFKKSLSGVLGNLGNKKDYYESNVLDEKSDNWFLSKSAPNSLTHTFHSLERHKIQDDEDQPYPSNVNTSSRLIYLPEIDLNLIDSKYNMKKYKYSAHSKSCEDLGFEMEKHYPEQLQDPIHTEESSWKIKTKPKKYTFQSTIRQIEKKRLSDKLSREAEKREMKRLRELEAMQKVEEEFQKKRAREKANIRQQLRLYSLDDNSGWHSLPPNFEVDHKEHRSEPDGAFSSVSSSSGSINNNSCQELGYSKISNFENKPSSAYTRELSEYRQTQRNYKDYSSNIKYTPDKGYPNRQTTVHPQVSCNMPKVKGLKTKKDHNYRKDFASGGRNLLSITSTHSEEPQNHSTKAQHRNKIGTGFTYNHLIPS